MMRRIDLLPGTIAEARRQRQRLTTIVVVGMALLGLLAFYWFMLGGQIADAEDQLADAQATNAQLQAQITELDEFARLEQELIDKQTALQTVMVGDINWPAILTELAMVVPGEVWFESLTASVPSEGQVGTETAAIRISNRVAIGSVTFQGRSLTMPGVAKWLIRLGTAKQFIAAFLENAAKGEGDDAFSRTVTFTSTVELSDKAASGRFQVIEP